MRTVAQLLAWVACAGHICRAKSSERRPRDSLRAVEVLPSYDALPAFKQLQPNSQSAVPHPLRGLALLLLTSDPSAAWNAADTKNRNGLAVNSRSSELDGPRKVDGIRRSRDSASSVLSDGGYPSGSRGKFRDVLIPASLSSERLLWLRGGADEGAYGDYMVPEGRTLKDKVPTWSLRKLREVMETPSKIYMQSPPITRSWVTASLLLGILTMMRVVDTRTICLDARAISRGEWWRLLTNLLFMGDNLKSIFFWMQLNHFWACSKMLELIKYRWEPEEFVKLIVGNAGLLCFFKQFFPHNMFLGTPLVMAFFYTYAMCNPLQPMTFLGFWMVRCSWLPILQMLQDWVQTSDITPNLLGFMSGHTYFYIKEMMPRMLLPSQPRLSDIRDLLLHGKPIVVEREPEGSTEEQNDDVQESDHEEDTPPEESEGESVTSIDEENLATASA